MLDNSTKGLEPATLTGSELEDEDTIVWQSTLTQEMVEHMSEKDLSNLIEELDSAVEDICTQYDEDMSGL
jgi:hypothetical protein